MEFEMNAKDDHNGTCLHSDIDDRSERSVGHKDNLLG
jgi:hypothetical protein